MLLALIDLLERLLVWLRTFSGQRQPDPGKDIQLDLEIPSGPSVVRRFGELKVQYPIREQSDAKTCIVTDLLSGNVVISPTKASAEAWDHMFREFHNWYNVVNV